MSIRPRGFIENWSPRDETRALLDAVIGVLAEYAELLPLTIRQIFYRLVGRCSCAKTERAYKRLAELLNTARRARLIDMDAVRDDDFARRAPQSYASVDEFLSAVEDAAKAFVLDRQPQLVDAIHERFRRPAPRWMVERTFSWFGRNRRLAKDFENFAEALAAFVTIASIQLALRRLARA
jgi:hypothetical protein